MAVDVKGIVLKDDPDDTANVTEELGGITLTVSLLIVVTLVLLRTIGEVVTQDTDLASNDMVTITWKGLNFTKAGQTFTIDIKNVKARDRSRVVLLNSPRELVQRVLPSIVPPVEWCKS